MRVICGVLFFMVLQFSLHGQNTPTQQQLDSLKRAVFDLSNDVNNIELKLSSARRNLTAGIFIATIGYSVTILGGQLLGTNPEAGEILLYAGGAIGIGGTVVLVNGFRKLRLRPELGSEP